MPSYYENWCPWELIGVNDALVLGKLVSVGIDRVERSLVLGKLAFEGIVAPNHLIL